MDSPQKSIRSIYAHQFQTFSKLAPKNQYNYLPSRQQTPSIGQKSQNKNSRMEPIAYSTPFSYDHQLSSEKQFGFLHSFLPSKSNDDVSPKQYIPLSAIVDFAMLKANQLSKLNFQHIQLNSNNQNSLNKVVFKHNEENKEIRFYVPTFLRFSLIKLHSQDLKNITHIENKNNMIIYFNICYKGLPKVLVDKLTKKAKADEEEQDSKIYFRANRQQFEAKYYATFNNYLIFMFNAFSEDMIEFQIIKHILYAPFQEAQLILDIKIDKKIFKLEKSKTLKVKKNLDDSKIQGSRPEQYESLEFNKIILEFKLQKPKDINDCFKFHKSIELGNYGIMTNEIQIDIGTYQNPEKKKQADEQKQQLGVIDQYFHQKQLQDISNLRLSIGLYKHPVTQICTFFIPMLLSGGLTILLFHLCDHDLQNELQVIGIILVAYGQFIPQFRQRLSMSRTVIVLDFYIIYNMIPAVLCAIQSIKQSEDQASYTLYEIISILLYFIAAIFLVEVYLLYIYVDRHFYHKNQKEMVINFDTQIFDNLNFEQDSQQVLSWFVLKGKNEKAYFCESDNYFQDKHKKDRKGFKRQTLYTSHIGQIQDNEDEKDLGFSQPLQVFMSKTKTKAINQLKESQEQIRPENKIEFRQFLYKTKGIEDQVHIHTFDKILGWKGLAVMLLIIVLLQTATVGLFWNSIYKLYTFQDKNRNCVRDQVEDQHYQRVQNMVKQEQDLQKMLREQFQKNSPNEEDKNVGVTSKITTETNKVSSLKTQSNEVKKTQTNDSLKQTANSNQKGDSKSLREQTKAMLKELQDGKQQKHMTNLRKQHVFSVK